MGLYGIQGVGKSHVLRALETERFEWRYVDGSALIRGLLKRCSQTMGHFKQHMTPSDKAEVRRAVIESAKTQSGVTLLAGHCSFPHREGGQDQESLAFSDVFTPADGATYDHIVYVEKTPEKVFDQVQHDPERTRPRLSMEVLQA